jgi:hypothetical protein
VSTYKYSEGGYNCHYDFDPESEKEEKEWDGLTNGERIE